MQPDDQDHRRNNPAIEPEVRQHVADDDVTTH